MTKIYSNKTKTEYSVKIFPFFSFGKMAKFWKKKKKKKVWKKISPHLDFDFSLVAF
jgi:hypothetical protein